jgi:hypothetical protein
MRVAKKEHKRIKKENLTTFVRAKGEMTAGW